MTITYTAIEHFDEDGIWVSFPDLPGCFSCGNEDNIKEMAEEAMRLFLHGMEIDKLPAPTALSDIALQLGENLAVVEITASIDVKNGRLFDPFVIEL